MFAYSEDLLFSSDDSDGFDVEVDGTSDQANYGSGSSDADTGTTTIPDGGAGSAIDADASATGPANPEFNQAVAHATHHHNLDFNQVRVMLAGTDDPFIHPMPAQVFHRNGPAPFVHPTPPVQFQGPFQPAAPVFHQDDSTATLPDAHHAPFVLAARRIPAIPGILAPVGGPVPYR